MSVKNSDAGINTNEGEKIETFQRGYKEVLPDYGKSWIRVPHLLKLNVLIILSTFVTATNSGFDGSILNGFQSMNVWESFF